MTAADIAKSMKCSRVAAYSRIRVLVERGVAACVGCARQGATGRESRLYALSGRQREMEASGG
jgi:predicted ArsR family transcriptional regulator